MVYIPLRFREVIFGWFIRTYGVSVTEMEKEVAAYPNFKEFFTRKLKDGLRSIDSSLIVSPVDGLVVSSGNFNDYSLFQVKGMSYSLRGLLNDSEMCSHFSSCGSFCTYYLAPGDYHRIHSPVQGEIVSRLHVPGSLYPVNDTARFHVPHLFEKNERVITCIRVSPDHYIVVVKVAALNVGCIGLSYDQKYLDDSLRYVVYDTPIQISKGDELGIFYLGSTVVVISSKEDMFMSEHAGIVRLGARASCHE